MIPDAKHQGFRNDGSWPEGIVRRVQAQRAHENFMGEFPAEDTVMMKIDAVERLLNRGHVRGSYFPDDFTVISSGIIHDDKLKELRWKQEGFAVDSFGPHFHIPTDYPVYGDMEKETRIENIENMMEGTRWMHGFLQSTDTKTLPLVKGYSPEERAICYETLRDLGTSYCAFYGSQYFGGEMGNGINKLNEDVRDVVSELDLDGMLLIGLQSRNGLEKMPPEVTAAAGQRWIDQSGLRDVPMPVAKQQYIEWRNRNEGLLGGGTATLGSFVSSEEVMVHG